MRQTFEELVDFDHECNMMDAIVHSDYDDIREEIIKLLVYVREQTIKECIDSIDPYPPPGYYDYLVTFLKSLPKDSILTENEKSN